MFLSFILSLVLMQAVTGSHFLNDDRESEPSRSHTVFAQELKSLFDQVDNRNKDIANTVFEIKNDLDLNNRSVILPDNCVLNFVGGTIKNGSITGNDITIIAEENRIFDNVFLGTGTTIKNSEVYLNWFCEPSIDCTTIVNEVIKCCKSIRLSKNTTYIVNSTITLTGEQGILFSLGSTIKKTSGTGPVIQIKGSNNSVLAPPKGGLIKSEVVTPNGLLVIGEYADLVLDRMTTHNKIDGLRFEGVISNDADLSIGLLCKNTGINVGAYYNSISNLDFRFFNVGVAIRGGFNGNILRDISFYACGGDYPPTHHKKGVDEAAIVMESWDIEGGKLVWGEVLENNISDIMVGYSPNGCPLLMIGSVKTNILTNLIGEPEGDEASSFKWRSKIHNGVEYVPKYNIVSCAGHTMQGPAAGGDFALYNIFLSGDAMTIGAPNMGSYTSRIRDQLIVANRIIDDSKDTWKGRDSRTAEYAVVDGQQYEIGTLTLRNGGDDALFMRIYISSISSSFYAYSSVFNIQVFRDSKNSIKYNVWGEYDDDGYRLLEIESNITNKITIGVRAPSVGTGGSSLMRITTEVYSREPNVFSLYTEPVRLKKKTDYLNFDISGWDSQRPSNPKIGTSFFSKDLGRPIWYKGEGIWVDANGSVVE